jgi:hypothetical protein
VPSRSAGTVTHGHRTGTAQCPRAGPNLNKLASGHVERPAGRWRHTAAGQARRASTVTPGRGQAPAGLVGPAWPAHVTRYRMGFGPVDLFVMAQISGYLNSLNVMPGTTVMLNISASSQAGKLTLSCFHSLDTSECLLSFPINPPTARIPIPEDWQAGMYKLIVTGSESAKWEGILVVRPLDVDVRSIAGARAPPNTNKQVIREHETRAHVSMAY